jgi:hypothetical protein
LITVDQILVAERDAEHPLRHHRLDRVLHLRLRATIGEAGSEPTHQTNRPIGRSKQQRAAYEVTSPPSTAATTRPPSTTS